MSGRLSPETASELVRRSIEQRDGEALNETTREFLPRMRQLARSILRRRRVPEVRYEADDAVDSALGCIVAMVMRGQIKSVPEVDGFWALFRTVLVHRIREEIRRQEAWKRGGNGWNSRTGNRSDGDSEARPSAETRVRTEYPDNFDFFSADLPSVDAHAIANETVERFLAILKPDLECVARLKLQGWTIPRIAVELGVCRRTVDARWQAARDAWKVCEFVQEHF
jgi:DNA-directed RNA polymerase specialized sigma24 family protein